ncbi:LuxR C-terminal-related transcriptional regulator [Virgisporangium aurantiacum]|uniref:LuxR family transcriptional regulator n=1 Tax=Virgisporangium aurantiacum TaxID=175570 RepID=A0A8J4E240_9ACTN|nr:LuxR family transcriptional regulator [Virgisporangium aurantiacum]GIJ58498.1 LuxR family transcriptional regulator [Virgisporangium aurantiacum]
MGILCGGCLGTSHDRLPLIGRERELESIATVIGTDSSVVLLGAAGVGKTRLAREALHHRRRAHQWVVGTRAAASIPLGAVSHLLPDGGQPGDTASLVRAVAARLTAQPGVVVGVDDAHLLDDASVALLHQLVLCRAATVVATVRTGDPGSDPLLALWKDTGERLTVHPLPDEAVDLLLAQALPGPIDPISRRHLRRLAAGNPLLLRELLADARQSGTLATREGIWHWRGPGPAGARVGDLVLTRVRELDKAARAVLEIVACGEPLALSVVERLAGTAAVDAAERSGMVVAERSGDRTVVRLAHPLYGEGLRSAMPVARARAIWRDLAVDMAVRPMRRRDDVLLAGVWELQSGTVRRPDVLLAAARQAMARFDLALAERLARASRSAATAARGSGGEREADWLLAEILQFRGRGTEAAAMLPDHGSTVADPARAVTRAMILYWGLGQREDAEKALDASDTAEATRSWIMLFDGRCREALGAAESVLRAPDSGDQAVIWAAMGGGFAAGLLGRTDRAAAIAEQGRAVADAHAEQYPWGQAQVAYGLCMARFAAGAVGAAREIADAGYGAAVARDARAMAGLWAAFRGVVAKAAGRIVDAGDALREAVVLLEDGDTYQVTRVILAELAGAYALAGDATAAANCLARADAMRAPVNRLFHAWMELDRAWATAAGGARSAAATLALRAADLARRTDQPTIEAICRYDAARLGEAARVQQRLHVLAGEVDGEFVAVLAGAARALAGRDGAGLDRATGQFGEHDHRLLAAETATAAAQAYRRDGRVGLAHRAAERAATLRAGCQGARTPLLDLDGPASVLTPREREIATLAIGLPSREVARRLGVSVRTVDNHLARIYQKLGITGRAELRAIIR